MKQSRRDFILSGLMGAAAVTVLPGIQPVIAYPWESKHRRGLARRIVAEFSQLPGTKSLKILAPGGYRAREFSATLNPQTPLFCASAFKVYVLAEYLRQVEAGEASLDEELDLDDSVWSVSSTAFNPPKLTGKVTAQTTLEAMISVSDNTATDMALKRVGADRVRTFISSIGLQDTHIPTSTRQMFGYIYGDPQWETITWTQLLDLIDNDPFPHHPIINNVQTMVASSHDFVSFYSRALQGEFFEHRKTLETFRAILALPPAPSKTMPLGINDFLKGGRIDFQPEYALSRAGGLWVPNRWVYYSMMINWTEAEGALAEVTESWIMTVRKIYTLVRDGLGQCKRGIASRFNL